MTEKDSDWLPLIPASESSVNKGTDLHLFENSMAIDSKLIPVSEYRSPEQMKCYKNHARITLREQRRMNLSE